MAFRLFRLYPIHIVTLIVFIFFSYFLFLISYFLMNNYEFNLFVFISNITLTQSFFPNQVYYFSLNSVSWSISSELFFYISFCVLVMLNTRAVVIILIFILALNIYFSIHGFNLFPEHWLLYINPFFRLSDFIFGMLSYKLYSSGKIKLSYTQGGLFQVFSIIVILTIIITVTTYNIPMNYRYDLIFIIPMTLIVCAFSLCNGFISKMLDNKYLLLLGDSSFSFYMVHQIILLNAIHIFNPVGKGIIFVILFSLSIFLLCVVLSIILYKLVEYPANSFLRRKWSNYRRSMQKINTSVKYSD